MRLTRRGRIVVNTLLILFVVFALAVAGRFDAMDQCAKFQAYNDWQSAKDAGCSFDPLPNGEYPYTWTP
jgi:hypothetical protein